MAKQPMRDGQTPERRATPDRRVRGEARRAQSAADRRGAPDKPRRPVSGGDPYNRGGDPPRQVPPPTPQRSLDDMRRLSEAIKMAPNWTPSKRGASSALYKRLDAMRAGLERTLAELLSVIEGSPRQTDRDMQQLIKQLRAAAYHLEGTIDYLKLLGD